VSGRRATSQISPARQVACDVIRASFEAEAHTERAFRQAADGAGLKGRERAQAQRLAFGTVQRRGTIDAGLERLVDRPLRQLDPPVLAGLRLGAYELLFADGTPDHAAVDQAVELVKQGGAAHAAGFANAVLRRFGRERERLARSLLGDDSTPEKAAVAHSAPLWLAQMWWRELGPEDARSLLAACNEPPENAFRVNTLRISPEAALERLRDAGLSATPAKSLASGATYGPVRSISRTGSEKGLVLPETVVIDGPTGELVPEMVGEGLLTPQSRGSAAVVEVLDPQPGEHVLDLCAGPGIKTGQIAARMEDRGEVISVESDPERAAEVAAQAKRLGLRSVTVIEADATDWQTGPAFDRVLLDAPCSDLGALASRPDARWRKSPATIERLVELQAQLLERACEALRPGGTLVYSTCTISARENVAPAGADYGVQLRPDRDRTTGFFIGRLSRDDGDDG
jgi:16S rRNA (cytosine967-C5)-methyltransferase